MVVVDLFSDKQQRNKFPNYDDNNIFYNHSASYYDLGLPIIPCGGETGKISQVKWATYQKQLPEKKIIKEWQRQFPTANIGLITGGQSNITVIDIDSGKPDFIQSVIDRFGDTPMKITTPRGGVHLYYRFNDESSYTAVDGLPVDVRGNGGYIVAPPSFNASMGRCYQFIEGSLRSIQSLPCIKRNSLNQTNQFKSNANPLEGDMVPEGQRNNALYQSLVQKVKDCCIKEELEDIAYALNDNLLSPPLPCDEVAGLIENVWQRKALNKIYCGGERLLSIMGDEILNLHDHPDAFWLLMRLRQAHDNQRSQFAIAIQAMANQFEWEPHRLAHARNILLERHYLKLVHRGGNHAGDVHLFSFY